MTSSVVRNATTDLWYSPAIHQQAFALWYELGRPPYKKIEAIMKERVKEGERSPNERTLRKWHTEESWEEHADALDGQAEAAGDKQIILQRANIIKKGAEVGAKLVDLGMDYLEKNGIENSADAIRAIGKGMELEEKLLGWAAVFQKLSQADDSELNTMLKKYMTTEIIEATASDATEQPDDTERPE